MELRPDVQGPPGPLPRSTRDPDRDATAALIYGVISTGICASIVARGTFEPVSRLLEWLPRFFGLNATIVWLAVIPAAGIAAIRVGMRARRNRTDLRRATVGIVLGYLGTITAVLGAAAFALLVLALRDFQF